MKFEIMLESDSGGMHTKPHADATYNFDERRWEIEFSDASELNRIGVELGAPLFFLPSSSSEDIPTLIVRDVEPTCERCSERVEVDLAMSDGEAR